jgi:hypothetical protein
MRKALSTSVQHCLSPQRLQLAPAERRRSVLLKLRDTCFERVDLEHNPFECIEAPLEIVHARAGTFEQRAPAAAAPPGS